MPRGGPRKWALTSSFPTIDPTAPGFAYADSCLIADVYGPDETACAAERYHRKVRRIDGVICVAADAPKTTAAVNERLGLQGLTRKSAALACDKLAMKKCFAEAGVAVPWFSEVATPQELQRIAVGTRARSGDQARRQPRLARRAARRPSGRSGAGLHLRTIAFADQPRDGRAISSGPQVSTESVVVDGHCYTPGFSDRNYELLERYAPYFVENGGDLPSHLSPDLQEKVKDVVAKAAAALGVTNGTVKGDIVVHNGEAYVIELAARLSGGFFCTREIPLNTGVDFLGAAIKVALGEAIDETELEPKYQTPVIQRYAFPKPGQVMSIEGAEDARKIAGVYEVIITAKQGDIIPAAGDKRPSAAMVLASGSSREAALAAANDALACLRIKTA